MKFVDHNDITSANINTSAPLNHQGPLEHNFEPDHVAFFAILSISLDN